MKIDKNKDDSKVINYDTNYDKLYNIIKEAIDEDRFINKSIKIVYDEVYITFKHRSRKGSVIQSKVILSKYYKSTYCEDSYNLIILWNNCPNYVIDEVKEEETIIPANNISELISKLDSSYIDAFAKYKHNVLEDIIIDNLIRIGCPKDVACTGNMEDIYHWLLYNYGISYSFRIDTEEPNKGSYIKKLHIECIDADKYYSVFSYSKEFTNENDYRSAYYTLNNFAISAICSYVYINRLERLS